MAILFDPNHGYLEAARKVGDIENLNRAKEIQRVQKIVFRKAEARNEYGQAGKTSETG